MGGGVVGGGGAVGGGGVAVVLNNNHHSSNDEARARSGMCGPSAGARRRCAVAVRGDDGAACAATMVWRCKAAGGAKRCALECHLHWPSLGKHYGGLVTQLSLL